MSFLISPPKGAPSDVSDIQLLYNIFLALTGGVPGAPVIPTFSGGSTTPVTAAFTSIGASASGTIPAGTKAWSLAFLTGTGTIGGVSVTAPISFDGQNTLAAAIPYTTDSASSALLYTET